MQWKLLIAGAFVWIALGNSLSSAEPPPMPAATNGLIGHWTLQGDCRDSSGHENHGAGRNVAFGKGPNASVPLAAVFDGRSSLIEVPDTASLHLGKNDFSLSAWVKPESPMKGVFGDIAGKYDSRLRRGFNFHIAGSSPGYQSMSDSRHVHFGADDGYLGPWEDCGQPCPSNNLVTSLLVFEEQLYCGIADAESPRDAARVFRYAGGEKWIDCGRLGDNTNHLSVQSMIVHQGSLYAGTGMWDWERARGGDPGKDPAAAPRVFVYEGGTKWRDLGQVGETTRVLCMASYQGELYAGLDSSFGRPCKCVKYNGSEWIDCGSPEGKNLENLLPLGGTLYGDTHVNIFRYEGGKKWTCIGESPFGIEQIHSMDVYRGRLHVGTWPQGYVLRYEGDKSWTNLGRLGLPVGGRECNEVNDLTVYNGKLYAGVIPKAEAYRYEADGQWTMLGSLGHRQDWARDNYPTWCRLTAMASFGGRLFAGTGSCRARASDGNPDGSLGRVYAMRAGQVVSHERDIGGGWTHLAVVRRGTDLHLYVNGRLSVSSQAPERRLLDLSNTEPLVMGFGAQSWFTGNLADVRLYARALDAQEVKSIQVAGAAIAAEPARLVLRGGSVFDPIKGSFSGDRTVVIEGARIRSVNDPRAEAPQDARVVDCKGKFILPGLIDAHVHLVHMANLTHVTGDQFLPMFLANGVTSVRDTGDEIVAESIIARSAEHRPAFCPRVFLASPLIDSDPPFHRDVGYALTDPTKVNAFVAEMVQWKVTTLKLYVGTTRPVGRAVIEEGHRAGLKVTAHLGNYSAQDAVMDGIDCLEHIWSVFNFIIPPDEAAKPDHRSRLDLDNPLARKLIAALAERRVNVDPTLVVFRNMIYLNDLEEVHDHPDVKLVPRRMLDYWRSYRQSSNLSPETRDNRRREVRKYQELTGLLHRAGVPLLAGTDAPEPFVPPGSSLHQELEMLVESGLSPAAALSAATINNAKVLGQEDHLGSVSPGKLADLVILDADPTVDIRNTRRIHAVVRGGLLCDPAAILQAVPVE